MKASALQAQLKRRQLETPPCRNGTECLQARAVEWPPGASHSRGSLLRPPKARALVIGPLRVLPVISAVVRIADCDLGHEVGGASDHGREYEDDSDDQAGAV